MKKTFAFLFQKIRLYGSLCSMPEVNRRNALVPNSIQSRYIVIILFLMLSVRAFLLLSSGATVPIPNGSFELPLTDFANPQMDGWQKAPEPEWYVDPTGMFPWEALMGQFRNTTNGSPDHIDNMDGNQAAYLFALPGVSIFQDYNPTVGTNSSSFQMFNALFEAGKSYALTVGVLGGGGGMSSGATLEISLYYRDASNNPVIVASTIVTNSPDLFPTNTHLTDFQVRIPSVKPTDAWAGKRIGIRIASTVGLDRTGGYWVVDNVRLTDSVLPNDSFESPTTDFASPEMDNWEKSSQPVWYFDSTGMFPWEALMGQFLNTTNGSPDHIDNMDGKQAAYLFALPEVAISQDYNSISGTNATSGHEFNAVFEPGKSYALTVGVIGGGGGMSNGATLEISLYYRNDSSNKIKVAAVTITNSPSLFPTNTHLIDFQVNTPAVKSNDPWAGKHIGIQIASTVGFDKMGGYWVLDNVRLTENLLANNSFEFPDTDFAHPAMDAWQKSQKPFWYDESGGFLWDQLMGQFLNPAVGATNRTDNMDGKQAAWLFAVPEVAIFQDCRPIYETNAMTGCDFNGKFEVGKSYMFTAGVNGGGGNMSEGATLEISFYYLDDNNNRITVAATTITNTPLLFPPEKKHFHDFTVQVPTVKGFEPWAGRYMGVKIASTVGFDKMGGFWTVDNARLRVIQDPVILSPEANGGKFKFTLKSAPGRYEILTGSDIKLPLNQWTSLGTVTNFTDSVLIIDTNMLPGIRFYRVRQSP